MPILEYLGNKVPKAFLRSATLLSELPGNSNNDRIKGYLPVTIINPEREDRADRMASTIRHNRARGKHSVDGMSALVQDLSRRNWSEEKIARELGMEADEVLRLKQITGLAEMFADKEFSEAWEAE